MHLLSFSARGLASNPVVMVTPRVVVVVVVVVGGGTGLGLGGGGGVPPPGHARTHTHAHTHTPRSGVQFLKNLAIPWSAFHFSSSLCPLSTLCLFSFREIETRIIAKRPLYPPISHYTPPPTHTLYGFMCTCMANITPFQTYNPSVPSSLISTVIFTPVHTGIIVFNTHVKWYER